MAVGISDIALYFPRNSISLEEIAAKRMAEDAHWESRMPRALQSTGQKRMRFPHFWEDPVTLAAQAAKALLDRRNPLDPQQLRYLVLGTETSVDMSKPGSNYVLGALKRAGYPLSQRLSSWQVQHACAGGTLGLLSVAGLLASSGRKGESGLVLTSDIARYKAPSTAEITQGAGASALLVEKDPALLALDLDTAGYYSEDVDDFFRPLGSTIAKVKGGFSLECYHASFLEAFEDHCRRSGVGPREEIESIDYWALHVPYSLMPVGAMLLLLKTHLGLEEPEARKWLEARSFFRSLEPSAQIGNIYTGSLYLSLAWTLSGAWEAQGKSLVGKKVLLASYGSGNTMAVFTARVQPRAGEVIGQWNLEAQVADAAESTYEEYLQWLKDEKTPENFEARLRSSPPPAGLFRLGAIREDGYREYSL